MGVGCDTKRCARCGEDRLLADFPPSKQRPDGLFNYCRSCKRLADRESWARRSSGRNRRRKAAYAANPEPAKARARKRRQEKPDEVNAASRAWAKANPEKRAAITRKWQQANMQGRVRGYTRKRYAIRKGAPTIDFTPEQLDQRAAVYGHACWICSAPMTEWDHVKPLAKGGWHCLSNLRPICRTCNARKRDTWPLTGEDIHQ